MAPLPQVQVLFPERSRPDFGVLRTIVKDSQDAWLGNDSYVIVDSDGAVSDVSDVSAAANLTPEVGRGAPYPLKT